MPEDGFLLHFEIQRAVSLIGSINADTRIGGNNVNLDGAGLNGYYAQNSD